MSPTPSASNGPRRGLPALLALMLALWLPLFAHAGIVDAPGEALEVSLVTYGPGDIYWERFGHDAIELRDRGSGETINFNYGVFDFDASGFLLNFARGRMRYLMDAGRAAPEIAWYIQAGRSVTRQRLVMTPAQAGQLRDALLVNLRPGNAPYDYDYYSSNCTTKVRDALDRVLGGTLREQLGSRPGRLTYRQQTDRLMAAQPWLMLLLDLGLGPFADQPLDAWQESFLPSVLEDQLSHAHVADSGGGTRPLVASTEEVATAKLTPPPLLPPDLHLPLLLAGLFIGTVLAIAGRQRGHPVAYWVFGGVGTVYVLFAGLAGLFMTLIWTWTAHRAGWANANLLLFEPLALLALAAVWRRRRSPIGLAVTWLAVITSVIALACNVLDVIEQQNLPWILLGLPAWIGLAYGLMQGPDDHARNSVD